MSKSHFQMKSSTSVRNIKQIFTESFCAFYFFPLLSFHLNVVLPFFPSYIVFLLFHSNTFKHSIPWFYSSCLELLTKNTIGLHGVWCEIISWYEANVYTNVCTWWYINILLEYGYTSVSSSQVSWLFNYIDLFWFYC